MHSNLFQSHLKLLKRCAIHSTALLIWATSLSFIALPKAQAAPLSQDEIAPPTVIVVGFVGGFVRADDERHPEVQMIERISEDNPKAGSQTDSGSALADLRRKRCEGQHFRKNRLSFGWVLTSTLEQRLEAFVLCLSFSRRGRQQVLHTHLFSRFTEGVQGLFEISLRCDGVLEVLIDSLLH
jgi:hypothetical protein